METRERQKSPTIVRGLRILGMVIVGAVGITAMAFIFGYFVMRLWNWLMPELFDLQTISFWQAAGIIILARLIFGAFKHGDHKKPPKKCGPHSKDNDVEHWVKYGRSFKKDKWNKWKYYDEYWENEGKQSFDEYIDRKKNANPENLEDDPQTCC